MKDATRELENIEIDGTANLHIQTWRGDKKSGTIQTEDPLTTGLEDTKLTIHRITFDNHPDALSLKLEVNSENLAITLWGDIEDWVELAGEIKELAEPADLARTLQPVKEADE